MADYPRIDGPESFAKAFDVSRETLDRLCRYAEILCKWQPIQNLVAPKTLPDLWNRHIADSAQLLAFAPDARIWVDIGTGAGFPGMVIAILLANHGECGVHLIESNERKCAFLGEVARETEAAVTLHNKRVEALDASGLLGQVDIVTARAVAPLNRLLELTAPFFNAETRGLFLKGRRASEEVDAALETWTFRHQAHSSKTDAEGVIIEIGAPQPRHAG